MRALNRMLLRDLGHLRAQAIAVAAVVACGVATFVALRSVYNSLILSQQAYYEEYAFAQVFAQVRRAPESVARRIEAIPGVAAVQTRVVTDVILDVPDLPEPAVGRLISLPDVGRPALNDVHLRQGSLPAPGADDEVLASEAFAEANGLTVGDSLGAVVGGRWRWLRIAGIALSPEYIYEIRGVGEVLPDRRRFGILWLNRSAVAPALDLDGAFNDVALALAPGASEVTVIDALDRIVERYGGLGAFGREDQVSHRFVEDEIAQNRVTSVLVPTIFLGVAAFLLNILLTRLVAGQRDQIAVLKAFGYRDVRIGAHYAALALVIVLAGAAVGAVAGIWLGSELMGVYGRFYRFPIIRYHVGAGVLSAAVLVNVIAALVGAESAVRRAVALPPAEAMRPESPPRYRPGIVDRLGLQRFLSPVTRITVRNIERRPARAALSVLGVGLAIAILVVGRFFFDAIDFVADLQFRQVMRDDVAVTFEGPLPDRARHAVARLPGVLRAEPYRIVPVRLVHEHREYRTAVQARVPDAELRRVVDRHGRVIPVPEEGIVLTSMLADLLALVPGDAVTVEVLEGRRLRSAVPVTGLADEVIGVSAYMSLAGVTELIRERSLTGAYLAVDPLLLDTLYDRLKETPAVAGVSIREVVLRNFQETIAQSLRISTTALVVFASVIAVGIVYNGARIALSERGRELMTLRVLGFRRREVAGVLLGEQAALTLVAVPVGFAVGVVMAAAVIRAAESELFRFPLVFSTFTFAFAFLIVGGAAVVSGFLVYRRLDRMDPVEVLKSRE